MEHFKYAATIKPLNLHYLMAANGTLTANKVLTTKLSSVYYNQTVNGKSNTFDLDTTFEQGSILYASSANTLTKLLMVNGNILSWQNLVLGR